MEWSEKANDLPLPCLPVQSSALSMTLTPAQCSSGQHPPAVQRVQGQTDTLHMGAKNHWLLVDISPPHELYTLQKTSVFQEILLERDLIVPMTTRCHEPTARSVKKSSLILFFGKPSLSLETEAKGDSKGVILWEIQIFLPYYWIRSYPLFPSLQTCWFGVRKPHSCLQPPSHGLFIPSTGLAVRNLPLLAWESGGVCLTDHQSPKN